LISLKGKLVWIGEDRTKETLDQFFKKLSKDGCKKILAIAMDMWTSYESSTREHCPQAKIVYDKFHIISAYDKVIDKVRRQEKNFIRHRNKIKKSLKGQSICS
jgi:transposase